MEHGGLFAKETISQVWVKEYDSQIEGLVTNSDIGILLHFDGTDGATSTIDSSQYGSSVNMYGGAQLDTDIVYDSNFGSTCLFNGSTSYVTVAGNAGTNVFLTGDFWSVEFFVKHASLTGTQVYYGQYEAPNEAKIFHEQGVGLRCTSNILNTTGAEITDTNWHHVLYVRKHNTHSAFYLDGQQVGYQSVAGISWTIVNDTSFIGRRARYSQQFFNGSMEEFRIAKGNIYSLSPNAGLTDSFTPPAVPYTPDAYDPMVVTVDPTYEGNYRFKIYIVNAYDGVSGYYLNLSPGGSYHRAALSAVGATVSAGRTTPATSIALGSIDDLGGVCFADVTVSGNNGLVKACYGTAVSRVSGSINQQLVHIGAVCNQTAGTSSFTISSDRTKGLGLGTRIIMYQSSGV